jgi:putative acetyltransferase
MTAPVAIRTTQAADRASVLALVAAAMHDQADVDLVDTIWQSPWWLPELDLVAVRDDVVIGHILHSLGTLGSIEVPALAPLAVAPAHQGAGVGTALVGEAMRRAAAAAHPLVVVTGHWDYYTRLGFEPAVPLGIHPLDASVFPDLRAFMVHRLPTYAGEVGTYVYSWERSP